MLSYQVPTFIGRIYVITNIANGKQYIGQTIQSIDSRWRGHIQTSYTKADYPLPCAIRKYGRQGFKVTEIAIARSRFCLNQLEQYYIRLFQTASPRGYNLDYGGGVSKRAPEIGKRISEARKGRKLGPQKRPRTPEHSLRLSLARRGKPSPLKGKNRSPEFREKLRKSFVDRPGHPHTEAFKQRLSERNKGNAYMRGRTQSPEHIRKRIENTMRTKGLDVLRSKYLNPGTE